MKRHRPIPGPCPCCGAQEVDQLRLGCLHDHAPGVAWDCLERDALAWVDRPWQPQPLTPEQYSLLRSAMQGLLWAVVPAIALRSIQLVHVHAVGVFPVSDALRFWLLTHEYARLSVPGEDDDPQVPTTATGWRLLVLSDAGHTALATQAARQGEG